MSADPETDHFAARGGLALLHRRWRPPAPGPRLAIALVHGLCEHCGRYDHVARRLAAHGCSVHAFDQRGHGGSEGPRAHTPDFQVLIDDVERFLARVRREEAGRPLVVLGHSLGGLEVATLLGERRPAVAAAVLTAPALALPGSLGARGRIARALARVGPRLPVPSGFRPDDVSRDPEVVAAYAADPLIPRRLSAAMAAAVLGASSRAGGLAREIEVPVLIAHGEADRMCPVEASRRFHADLRTTGSELRTYPGLYHEILNEPERDAVIEDIAAWLDKTVAA